MGVKVIYSLFFSSFYFAQTSTRSLITQWLLRRCWRLPNVQKGKCKSFPFSCHSRLCHRELAREAKERERVAATLPRIKENPIFQTTIDKQSILNNSPCFLLGIRLAARAHGNNVAVVGGLSRKSFITGHIIAKTDRRGGVSRYVLGVVSVRQPNRISVVKARTQVWWKCN
uniref:Putative secreted protein n=1 Tax=Anopheles triannulatus TaxID=58253 RepID=A0A2M4B492_9DIPT